MNTLDERTRQALFEYLLRLGDDRLILGHRLSELCGHGPILEQDIAMTNIALDCVGQAEALLHLAGEVEAKGRGEDDLAYFRDEIDFRNALLVEQPNGDFAKTIARQFIFDSFGFHLYDRLRASEFEPLADIAAKALKEVRYHLRHSGDWMLRLGDGTDESRRRTQKALDELWIYTAELFEADDHVRLLNRIDFAPEPTDLQGPWRETVETLLDQATLTIPRPEHNATGGRRGRHTEHLGHLLAEMQILARSFPGADW